MSTLHKPYHSESAKELVSINTLSVIITLTREQDEEDSIFGVEVGNCWNESNITVKVLIDMFFG